MAKQRNKLLYMKSLLHFLLFFIIILSVNDVVSQTTVTTLPGYPGTLPFKLETGYISVGEKEEVELFYYFIESESDPKRDPLVFWLTGGPGCSGFSGLVFEIGPLAFDLPSFDGSLPSFNLNPYSWTKVANIIFIDSPVGTGFSYATTAEAYSSNDTISAKYNYLFLRKWLSIHPEFLKNVLYIAGDSYAGKIVPMVALEIAKDNEAGIEPRLLLQGYITGNARTDKNKDDNDKISYAHRLALISDEYYELAKKSCHGQYVNPDPTNIECKYALRLIKECTNLINENHILEPSCKFQAQKPNKHGLGQLLVEVDPVDDVIFLSTQERPFCRNYNYAPSYVWANNETVQEALKIKKGTIKDWKRCNKTLDYTEDVESVLEYHRLLNEKGFQALVYSGDHDILIPYLSSLRWIGELNLTVDDDWRPWTVDGQIAGYTMKYKKNQAYLTFATVKGAGHTAPEYQPRECLAMIERWIGFFPL